MSIQLITFDLDDTLWDVGSVMRSAEDTLREWLATHAPQLGGVPIEHLWAIRARLLAGEPNLKYRLSELRRRILLLALQEAGYPSAPAEQLAEAGFQVFLEARHQVNLFADVHPTLEHLANYYQLGVITNGNADVRRLGLADYFRFTLCAEELGIGKLLQAQAALAQARAGEGADHPEHLGDHPDDETAGARAAGLRAIWFNPQEKPWGDTPRADAEVHNLAELPALLASWRQPKA